MTVKLKMFNVITHNIDDVAQLLMHSGCRIGDCTYCRSESANSIP